MEVFITYDKNVSLDRLNTPYLDKMFVPEGCKFPTFLEFNKTYYRMQKDNIIAFRVLAISCATYSFLSPCTTYLIQTPNKDIKWQPNFINEQSIIFENKDDMFEYMQGCNKLNINNKSNWKEFYSLLLEKDLISNVIYKAIKLHWKWDESANQPKPCVSRMHRIFINEQGLHIQLTKEYDGTYPTKTMCIQHQMDGFVINDFEEDVIEVSVKILPSKPKRQIIKIIAEEV